MSGVAPSQGELACFVRMALQTNKTVSTLQTPDGYPLSGVCAAQALPTQAAPKDVDCFAGSITPTYVVQNHTAATAEEILQVLSPEPDASLSAHPAYQTMHNAVHMLIANDEVPQYIANPDIHRSSHMYQSSFGDWA